MAEQMVFRVKDDAVFVFVFFYEWILKCCTFSIDAIQLKTAATISIKKKMWNGSSQ